MSPRMLPDGKTKMTNVGTVDNPIIVAKPDTPAQAMAEFARSLGVAEAEVEGFVAQWAKTTEKALQAPKAELLWRLNCRVQGEDPGEPVNWRGERGLYA